MRNGFTLIELLLVVVIIGILAAMALPKFSDIKARAHKASMQSDLRSLATNEVLFDADSGRYTTDLDSAGFKGSDGNAIVVTLVGTGGFTAQATRTDLPNSASICTIGYGAASSTQAVVCTGF